MKSVHRGGHRVKPVPLRSISLRGKAAERSKRVARSRVATAAAANFFHSRQCVNRASSESSGSCTRTSTRSCVQGESVRDERYRGSTGGDCSVDRLLKIAHARSDPSHNRRRSQRPVKCQPGPYSARFYNARAVRVL